MALTPPSRSSRSSRVPLFVHSLVDTLLLLMLCVSMLLPVIIFGANEEEPQCISTGENQCHPIVPPEDNKMEAVRIISQEELSSNKGIGENSRIWISVLGEVFDVTEGESHYGQDGSYPVFAGRDASPCFVTGEFTEEGAKKDINEVPNKDLPPIYEWKEFYADSDKYFFVGLLEGLYYDSNGNPTPKLLETAKRLEKGKIEQAQIRKERAAKRKQKLKDKEAKKKAAAAAAARASS